MAVLDYRQNTVMASPVRASQEAKAARIAMRNNTALADMNETAARDDHAGQALDINRGNMEAAQANVALRQKEFTKSLQAHMMTMSKEAREEDRAEATQALSVYQSAFEKTKDPNAAAEIALQFTDIDGTTPEQREQINQMAESLGGMDKLLESYIAADDDFKAKDGSAANVRLPNGDVISAVERDGLYYHPETGAQLPAGATQESTAADPMEKFNSLLATATKGMSPEDAEEFARAAAQAGLMGKGGLEFEADGEGGFKLRMGSGAERTVGSQTAATKSLASNATLYTQITAMNEIMTPAALKDALTLPGRLETLWDVSREKYLSMDLNPADRSRLEAMTEMMSRSTKVYSEYLFGRGGKNLTQTEKETVRGMMAKMGESWWDTEYDSPTQYATAMEKMKEYAENAMVRDFIIATNTMASDLSPEQLKQQFPSSSEEYKTLRGKMFREMKVDASKWVPPGKMGDAELEQYAAFLKDRLEALPDGG